MSRTETLLLVVLGFSLATLIALFAGRFVWSLGLRLGARRMQRQVPSTLVSLQAERDRLRAENAMLSQRLGARLEAVKLQMTEQMAEVSRHRNRIGSMTADLAARDSTIAERQSEIVTLRDRIAALDAAAAAANAELLSLRTELGAKDAELGGLRLAYAELERPAAPLYDAAPVEPAGGQDRLRQRIDALNRMSHSIAEGHAVLPAPAEPRPDPLFAEKLNQAERDTADLQRELERLDAEWSRKLDDRGSSGIGIEAPAQGGKSGAVANVISLANRIRALKKDIAK